MNSTVNCADQRCLRSRPDPTHITPALPYVSCTSCQSADEWISIHCLSFVGWHRSCVPIADERTLVTAAGRRPLRSADNRTCLVKRSRNQFGDCCFATAGPTLWNSLPEQLRQPDITFGQFKRSLKTFMFG